MSMRYVLEPPTTGQVLLKTTHGDIHIELWTREAPLACRNFIQLCLEGFYENSPFHRVIAGFMIQNGGDIEGESVFGGAFKDEFHSRLKFSHRGIVGMANSKKDDNRTQFFITLDKTPWLDRKNTIFGKVANNTIYNAIRISETEVDKNDRPLMLPTILSTEIIINPFDDIIPREKSNIRADTLIVPAIKLNIGKVIISYDEDLEEDAIPQKKIISSHDALHDPSLSKEIQQIEPQLQIGMQKKDNKVKDPESEDEEDFDMKMKKQLLAKREIFLEEKESEPIKVGNYKVLFRPGETIISKQINPEEEFDNLKQNLQLKLKRNPLGTNNEGVRKEEQEEATFLSPLQKLRYNYYQYNKKTKGREKETLGKLDSFLYKIRDGDDKKGEWFVNRLKFSVDSARAFAFNKDLPSKAPHSDDDDNMIADPVKRLKRYNEDDSYTVNNALSIENLLKLSNTEHHNN